MSTLLTIAKAFLPDLIKHGVEMIRDRKVLKDNLKRPSTAVAATSGGLAVIIEAVQSINPETLPTDPTATQAILGLIAVVSFLYRKYQARQ